MNGRVTPDLFDEEIVRDPHVLDHIDKIKVFAEPDFEAAFPKVQRCHVAIDTTDGRNFEKQIDWPKGDPRDPLTDSEIRAKFDALAQGLSTERGDEIWNEAAKLPDYSKVANFVALLKIQSSSFRSLLFCPGRFFVSRRFRSADRGFLVGFRFFGRKFLAFNFSINLSHASSRFSNWLRRSVAVTVTPLGGWTIRTAVSTLFRCWPPGPPERKKLT